MDEIQEYSYTWEFVPMPCPDIRCLDCFVGTWELLGSIRGTVTYEWMEGENCLTKHVDLDCESLKIKGIGVVGHLLSFREEPSGVIESCLFDTNGNVYHFVYEVDDYYFRIWSETVRSPAPWLGAPYYTGKFKNGGKSITGSWSYGGHDFYVEAERV